MTVNDKLVVCRFLKDVHHFWKASAVQDLGTVVFDERDANTEQDFAAFIENAIP